MVLNKEWKSVCSRAFLLIVNIVAAFWSLTIRQNRNNLIVLEVALEGFFVKKHSDGKIKFSSLTKEVSVKVCEVITRKELQEMDIRIAENIRQNALARKKGYEAAEHLYTGG